MTITGIGGTNVQRNQMGTNQTGVNQMGMNQAADSYSRNIQNQISNAQRQLQELSSNEDMSLEEKMEKRQEIQKQISDLNVQLRQHQIEQRREKQQAKGSSMDDMIGGAGNAGRTKAGRKSTGFSQAGMTAMLSADTSMKLANVQGSVAAQMEGRAGVLKSEIKTDQAGGNTQRKEEELANAEQRAQAATASQVTAVADAGRAMSEAAKADSRAEKTDKTDGTDNQDTKTAGKEDSGKNVSEAGASVDIRL